MVKRNPSAHEMSRFRARYDSAGYYHENCVNFRQVENSIISLTVAEDSSSGNWIVMVSRNTVGVEGEVHVYASRLEATQAVRMLGLEL